MARLIDGVDAADQRIVNVGTPTSPNDAVTKGYADSNYGGAQTRATATATTVSLAPGAIDTTTSITLSKGYVLYAIQSSRIARIELYTTAAAMTADASRSTGIDPQSSSGVVLDYVTPASGTLYSLGPVIYGSNLESVPTTSISMRVTNKDTTTGTITVTLVWLKVE